MKVLLKKDFGAQGQCPGLGVEATEGRPVRQGPAISACIPAIVLGDFGQVIGLINGSAGSKAEEDNWEAPDSFSSPPSFPLTEMDF